MTASARAIRCCVSAGTQADSTPLERAFASYGAPFTVLDIDEERPRDIYGYDLLLLRPDLHVVWRGNRLPTIRSNWRQWRRGIREWQKIYRSPLPAAITRSSAP